MSKFVKIPDTSGKTIIVNLDSILYVKESSDGISIIFGPKETGGFNPLNSSISLGDFLRLAEDKV